MLQKCFLLIITSSVVDGADVLSDSRYFKLLLLIVFLLSSTSWFWIFNFVLHTITTSYVWRGESQPFWSFRKLPWTAISFGIGNFVLLARARRVLKLSNSALRLHSFSLLTGLTLFKLFRWPPRSLGRRYNYTSGTFWKIPLGFQKVCFRSYLLSNCSSGHFGQVNVTMITIDTSSKSRRSPCRCVRASWFSCSRMQIDTRSLQRWINASSNTSWSRKFTTIGPTYMFLSGL